MNIEGIEQNLSLTDRSVELLVISEQRNALKMRAPHKYDTLLTTLDIIAIVDPLPQVAYHFGRIADDLTDGDRALPGNHHSIPDLLTSLEDNIHSGVANIPRKPTPEYLLRRTIERFDRSHPDFDIRKELLRFLNAMKREYSRRTNGISLTKSELWDLYNDGFGAPHSIMLSAFGSRMRDYQIPELSLIQGRRYAIAGWNDDLPNGVINIPREILEAAQLPDKEVIKHPLETWMNPIIKSWRRKELSECDRWVKNVRHRSLDIPARLYVRVLT